MSSLFEQVEASNELLREENAKLWKRIELLREENQKLVLQTDLLRSKLESKLDRDDD